MKYRKKPIYVFAEQWDRGKKINGLTWPAVGVIDGATPEQIEACFKDVVLPDLPRLRTPDGYEIIFPGDWVVTYENGDRHRYKNEMFQLMYEPVEE